ncbi:heme ABC transporter permease CcmC [Aquabacterium sp.]|uniref:heme ABC transporter permease CcmC n=1 Tax=Aquabacterium sp. TaxID=1872578 RepID=UPI0025BFE378|nr:heme ABC transporter permease CcmC [Aquabacterium sp.]
MGAKASTIHRQTGQTWCQRLLQWASPQRAYPLAERLAPWCLTVALLLSAVGLYLGLFVAPTDHQQRDAYRIIYVHVPAAWLGMVVYVAMAFWAALGWVLNTRLSSLMARALAPTGAIFTFLALWTGALWGKPTWGTWWVWDARLTSMLILLFLYIGFMALQAAIDDPRKGDKAGALLAIVGVVNVPIIYFSVKWWNTLHQGSSLSGGATMAPIMLYSMLLVSLGFWAYGIGVALLRLRHLILEREADADWVSRLPELKA